MVSDVAELMAALTTEEEIYLEPGIYTLNNPLVISRSTPLYLHAADRQHTTLVPANPNEPLIVVNEASLISLAHLRLQAAAPDGRVLVASNTTPFDLEFLDGGVQEGVLELSGPGSFRLQGTHLAPRGQTLASVVIDHPQADFVMMGGNISNTGQPSAFPASNPDQYHVWQKQGRLRIFSTGVQDTRGRADFRIDTASLLGPHAIVNVRSEGSNWSFNTAGSAFKPTLVYTPASSEAVDLVLLSNAGAWVAGNRGQLVDYSAAGKVWLVGNDSQTGADSVAVGTAPDATIVAIGNVIWDKAAMFAITAGRIIHADNIYCSGLPPDSNLPTKRFANPGLKLADYEDIPVLPETAVPEPILRPRVTAAVGSMIDVTAAPYNAAGDGVTDDSAALQAALDADCGSGHGSIVFFPAGTYRTTTPLEYNTTSGCFHATGGWLAGEGKDQSRIVRDPVAPGEDGSVFKTEGVCCMTLQGLGFATDPYDMADPNTIQAPAFSMENVDGVGHATQEVIFYDVAFDGGRYAVGIGLETSTQGSENLFVDSRFANAGIGFGVGSYNALANVVYASSFQDNDVSMGHDFDVATLSGGTWAVYGAIVRGSRVRDQSYANSASGVWYAHGLDTDSPVMTEPRVTSAVFPTVYEQSFIHPATPGTYVFDNASTAGPIFLHSRVENSRIRLSSNVYGAPGLKRTNYALSLYSDVSDWESATIVGDFSQLDELAAPLPVPGLGRGPSVVAVGFTIGLCIAWSARRRRLRSDAALSGAAP